MAKPHPKLCLRPKTRASRPKLDHPVFGILEFVNEPPGWWQGTTTIAGSAVRLDFEHGGKVSEEQVAAGAATLQWVQGNEPMLREYVGKQLTTGDFLSSITDHRENRPKLNDPSMVQSLRPCMVMLGAASVRLEYDCDSLPGGHLFGANAIEVLIEDQAPKHVFLMAMPVERRARMLLARPLPRDALDFENSIADQFLAAAASGSVRIDVELKQLLEQAIAETDERIRAGSQECAAYMRSVRQVLLEIASAPITIIRSVCADLVVKNNQGQRPSTAAFLGKVIIDADDGACKWRGPGPGISLFSLGVDTTSKPGLSWCTHQVHRPEAFLAALQGEFERAGKWLAKQPTEVFQSLREVGFDTGILICIWASVISTMTLDVPAVFLAECGRHGLALSTLIIQMPKVESQS